MIGASIVSLHAATGVLNFAQGSLALWGVWVVAELRRSGTLVLPVGDVAGVGRRRCRPGPRSRSAC